MRIEGRTRTGTSKIIFQVCREAKVNRERGLSGRRRATLKMRRRRTETFSLSSSLTFTVSFFWKKKNRLRENRDELWTHECQCETSWRLSHALPNYTRPTAKKDDDDTKIALNFWRRHFQQKWRIFFKAMALLDLAEYNMIQMNDDGTICWPEGCITPTHDFSRRRRLSRAPILVPHTAGLGFLRSTVGSCCITWPQVTCCIQQRRTYGKEKRSSAPVKGKITHKFIWDI